MDDDQTVRARILRMIGEAPDDWPGLPEWEIPLDASGVLSQMIEAGDVEVVEAPMATDPAKRATYVRLKPHG